MTVKIAKFLATTSVAGTTEASSTIAPQSQLPHHNNYLYPAATTAVSDIDFGIEEDFDSNDMSYSTAAPSIMTLRDHPFNNSSRPLLAERKPPQLLLNKKKLFGNKKSCETSSIGSSSNSPPNRTSSNSQSYPSKNHYQHRDSIKGLHGFNDFDIISEQYRHLNSHHIGYPYGSPPSPTANSNDFVFDTVLNTNNNSSTNSVLYNSPPPADDKWNQCSSMSRTTMEDHVINEDDYYTNIGRPSRFEDDFCCRRNNEFSKIPSDPEGPFIFGVHHWQKPNLSPNQPHLYQRQQDIRLSPDGSGFLNNSTVINDDSKYSTQNGMTSASNNSDTSSSSRDSGKGLKFLVRNRKKIKKNPKDKKSQKEHQPTVKCVVVGDGAVGKTNLILSYLENRFIHEHVPTASDIYNADVMVNDNPVHVTLCDTAGQDTLDPLRELCYPDSDVFLLCFSVAKPETFDSIKTKWAPKFSKTKASLILVGTQSDLRCNSNVLNKLQSNGEKPVSFADAWDLATSIGAKYIETSSSTQDKVKEVFDTAIWEALAPMNLPSTPPLWKKIFCLV